MAPLAGSSEGRPALSIVIPVFEEASILTDPGCSPVLRLDGLDCDAEVILVDEMVPATAPRPRSRKRIGRTPRIQRAFALPV